MAEAKITMRATDIGDERDPVRVRPDHEPGAPGEGPILRDEPAAFDRRPGSRFDGIPLTLTR